MTDDQLTAARRALDAAITLAVEVINRPASISRMPAIEALALTIDDQRRVMVEGVGHAIGAEVPILLDVLGHIETERAVGSDRAGDFCSVAGVLLTMARRNLVDVMRLAVQRHATTTEQDYRGKR